MDANAGDFFLFFLVLRAAAGDSDANRQQIKVETPRVKIHIHNKIATSEKM